MYDIIVIGSDVSALVTASFAAHLGARILLVDDGDTSSPVSLPGGYCFDADPLPWTGLDDSGVFSKLLHELHIEDVPGKQGPPGLQVMLESRTIEFSSGMRERCNDTARDFLLDHDETRRYFALIEDDARFIRDMVQLILGCPVGFRGTIAALLSERARRLARQAGRKISGLAVLDASRDLFHSLDAECSLFSRYDYYGLADARSSYCIYSSICGSCGILPGEKDSILEALRNSAEKSGGTIMRPDRIDSVALGDDILIEVSVEGACERIEGRRLVVSTKWRGFPVLIQNEKSLSDWYEHHFIPRRRPVSPFTLHLGVDACSIPESMGDHLVMLRDDNGRSNTPSFFYLQAGPTGPSMSAPAGRRALSVTAFLSPSSRENYDRALVFTADAMLDALNQAFPFLHEGIDSMDRDLSISRFIRALKAPALDHVVKERPLFGLPFNAGDTPRANVFITGGELAPLLGFDGDIISGINAAQRACGEIQYVYYP
ncbi:MAG: hypothetical protein AVO39_05480 [delta proteobacterium MLS_D]|jgi:phytoene dehydrogenase-like protein|nr:MAG: hypothetical protein AVO39_05480 [delta proteobacterium MLS_D]